MVRKSDAMGGIEERDVSGLRTRNRVCARAQKRPTCAHTCALRRLDLRAVRTCAHAFGRFACNSNLPKSCAHVRNDLNSNKGLDLFARTEGVCAYAQVCAGGGSCQ